MRRFTRLALGAGAVLGLSALVARSPPEPRTSRTAPISAAAADHAVFVQTDNTAGNQIVAYHRADDGTLTLAGTYATGGLGRRVERLGGRPPRPPRARSPTTRTTACSTP